MTETILAEMAAVRSNAFTSPPGSNPKLAHEPPGRISLGALYQPMFTAGWPTSPLTANAAARLLLSPIFVNWLGKASKSQAVTVQSYAQRLAVDAKIMGDDQFEQDVAAYVLALDGPLSSAHACESENGGEDGQ